MSRNGDLMRRSLKRILIPALHQMGFGGKTSTFQRANTQTLDLLTIQYWKYGGEFILEFASCGRGDMRTSWGPIVPEEKIDVAYISPTDRARLEQRGAGMGSNLNGFCFASFGENIVMYDQLANEVVQLLPQVDDWLKTKVVGLNLHTFK